MSIRSTARKLMRKLESTTASRRPSASLSTPHARGPEARRPPAAVPGSWPVRTPAFNSLACTCARAQTGAAYTEATDEGADRSRGHQEGGGKRIGPHLRQLLPVLGAAHEPAAIAVDEDVAVLVHTREHTASQRVVVVHDDRWPVPAVAEE